MVYFLPVCYYIKYYLFSKGFRMYAELLSHLVPVLFDPSDLILFDVIPYSCFCPQIKSNISYVQPCISKHSKLLSGESKKS